MDKKRFYSKAYIFSSLFLSCIVAAAFLIPSQVLKLQDRSAMKDIHYTSRAGLDYAIAYTEYEMSPYNRLKDFAQGCAEGRTFYAVSSDYQNDMDLDEICRILQEFGINLQRYLDKGLLTLLEQKYFIIYDDSIDNGVTFICRYLRLGLGDGELLVLMDGKDNMVYYYDCISDNSLIPETALKYASTVFGMGKAEYIDYLLYEYYESEYMESEKIKTYADNAIDEESRYVMYEPVLNRSLHYDKAALTMVFIYGNVDRTLLTGIGIKEIRELLPEY